MAVIGRSQARLVLKFAIRVKGRRLSRYYRIFMFIKFVVRDICVKAIVVARYKKERNLFLIYFMHIIACFAKGYRDKFVLL